jgi:hypothetical protein
MEHHVEKREGLAAFRWTPEHNQSECGAPGRCGRRLRLIELGTWKPARTRCGPGALTKRGVETWSPISMQTRHDSAA